MKNTIVGSTIKAIKKAKVYGTLDLRALNVLKVIYKLQNNAGLTLSDEINFELNRISRSIINKNKELCAYRGDSAYIEVNNNLFLTNTTNINSLYSLWLSQGNTGTLTEFLDLLVKDDSVNLETDNW